MARMLSGTKKGGVRKTARRAYKKPTVRRKRRVTKSKGLLSEVLTKTQATAGAKAVVSGAVGAGAAIMIEKFLTTQTQDKEALITAAAGFLTATVLNLPNVGAGMGAIALYKYADHAGMLNEDADWASVESMPAVLNENGQSDYLQAAPTSYDGIYLQDDDYSVGYYGAGFGG
jgi:methionine synthase II (cobalamin-independent)